MADRRNRESRREDEEDLPRPDLGKLQRFLSGPLDVRSVSLTGIFVLLVFYTLYFAKPFFLPVFLAVLLNFLLSPIVRGLKRIHVPETIGAGIVILFVLGLVGYSVYALGAPAGQWLDKAPQGMRTIERRIRPIQGQVKDVQRTAEQVQKEVGRMTGKDSATQEVRVQGASLSGTVLNRTQSILAGTAVVVILLYFLLASGDLFLRKLVRVLPRLEDKRRAVEIARHTERHISTYLATVTLINVVLGLVVGGAMALVGLPNPMLWGVVAAVLNYIPYLGPIVTLGVVTIVSLLTFDEIGRALVAPVVYFAINMTEGNFVTPMILGRRLTLNPVAVFSSLIFWGWLWGVAGALLAVPILATFKIFCDHIEPLAPIGEFLGR